MVEFGGAIAQQTIDRYVAGEDVSFAELRRVWTDPRVHFPPVNLSHSGSSTSLPMCAPQI